MKTTAMKVLPLCFLALTAACGGGGGGAGGREVPVDPPAHGVPGAYSPGSLGAPVFALMEGTWRVVAVELEQDSRNRNPDPEHVWLQLDDELTFVNGVLEEEDDPYDPPANDPQLPISVEYAINQVDGGALIYGVGFRVGENPYIGAGFTRMGAIFGRTGPATAIALVVQEDDYANWPFGVLSHFTALRVSLEMVSPPQ